MSRNKNREQKNSEIDGFLILKNDSFGSKENPASIELDPSAFQVTFNQKQCQSTISPKAQSKALSPTSTEGVNNLELEESPNPSETFQKRNESHKPKVSDTQSQEGKKDPEKNSNKTPPFAEGKIKINKNFPFNLDDSSPSKRSNKIETTIHELIYKSPEDSSRQLRYAKEHHEMLLEKMCSAQRRAMNNYIKDLTESKKRYTQMPRVKITSSKHKHINKSCYSIKRMDSILNEADSALISKYSNLDQFRKSFYIENTRTSNLHSSSKQEQSDYCTPLKPHPSSTLPNYNCKTTPPLQNNRNKLLHKSTITNSNTNTLSSKTGSKSVLKPPPHPFSSPNKYTSIQHIPSTHSNLSSILPHKSEEALSTLRHISSSVNRNLQSPYSPLSHPQKRYKQRPITQANSNTQSRHTLLSQYSQRQSERANGLHQDYQGRCDPQSDNFVKFCAIKIQNRFKLRLCCFCDRLAIRSANTQPQPRDNATLTYSNQGFVLIGGIKLCFNKSISILNKSILDFCVFFSLFFSVAYLVEA